MVSEPEPEPPSLLPSKPLFFFLKMYFMILLLFLSLLGGGASMEVLVLWSRMEGRLLSFPGDPAPSKISSRNLLVLSIMFDLTQSGFSILEKVAFLRT